jgi:hypothetical protein
MNELNKLYKAMLMSWGAVIKDNGKIMFSMGGEEFPIRIDEMDLYLPLSEVLDGNTIDKVFFHPACENIISKETEVFKMIRKMTCMKLLDTFRKYPIALMTVAAGKEKRAHRQNVLDILEPLKTVKRTVRDELKGLLERMHVEIGEDGLDNRFIHFKVTKGGGRHAGTGEKVYYKTKPQFPFYNEIIKRLAQNEGRSDNQTVELNNFTVSIAALKLAAHLFQSILPAVMEPDNYEFASTNSVGARLVSYLGCYGEIVDQLNRVQNMFRADFDKLGIYLIDMNWTEHLENLPDIYRQVPVMDYNSHNTQDEAETSATRTGMAGLLSVSSQQVQHGNQQVVNNQNLNQNQPQVRTQTMSGDFDTTPPQMHPGDQLQRTEIDMLNNRVLHHAINAQTGQQVVYQCTKQGNLLMRVENQVNPMAAMMGMGNGMFGMPNMGMQGTPMGNGMMMLPNGMVVPMGQPPVTASSAVNNTNMGFVDPYGTSSQGSAAVW